MCYPYDPNQLLMNMSQVIQLGGQSYLSQSQFLSQQRTAPPPQVQAIQPPPYAVNTIYLQYHWAGMIWACRLAVDSTTYLAKRTDRDKP